jgi:hypothetical protein
MIVEELNLNAIQFVHNSPLFSLSLQDSHTIEFQAFRGRCVRQPNLLVKALSLKEKEMQNGNRQQFPFLHKHLLRFV